MKKIFTFLFATLSIACFSNASAQGIISTICGNHTPGFSGDGGPATSAELYLAYGVCVDKSGDIIITDWNNHRIREISYSNGDITTIAGNGNIKYSGNGVPATSAGLRSPYGITLDDSGNIYFNDEYAYCVRKITKSTGIITTIAGDTTIGFSGDGGPAISAQLSHLWEGIAVDPAGNVYIGDYDNACIRKVSTAGIITTIAGLGNGFSGYTGDGGQATNAEISAPMGIKFDAGGSIFFADGGNNVIRKITTSGIISTVVGNGILGYSGDGGPATSSELNNPYNLAFAGHEMYIADAANNVVRRVDTLTWKISTFAGNNVQGYSGNGGPATSAELFHPIDVAFTSSGVLIDDDLNYVIREVTADFEGISELNTNDGLILYPNPANDMVYLTCENEIKQGTTIKLFDVSGKEVRNEITSSSSKTISINTANLANGLYLLKLIGIQENPVVRKLAILR